jgi:hypothetical protein
MQLFAFLRVISLEAMIYTSRKISNTVTLTGYISPIQQQAAEQSDGVIQRAVNKTEQSDVRSRAVNKTV